MRAMEVAERSGLRLMLLGLLVMLTVACAAQYRNHGYIPDEEDLVLIEVGRDTPFSGTFVPSRLRPPWGGPRRRGF